MPTTQLTWTKHKSRWINCEACKLCSVRKKVVLARGQLPCDVLFIGEAPGNGENTIGQPFVGKAGRELDRWVGWANDWDLRIAYTNLISCIPKVDGKKVSNPPTWAINACRPRLKELIRLARPKLTVLVGKDAAKYRPETNSAFVEVYHPAHVIRQNIAVREMTAREQMIKLREAFHAVAS